MNAKPVLLSVRKLQRVLKIVVVSHCENGDGQVVSCCENDEGQVVSHCENGAGQVVSCCENGDGQLLPQAFAQPLFICVFSAQTPIPTRAVEHWR